MDEALLLQYLRSGDEEAYTWLVQKYHTALVRFALSFVQEEKLAEEVAQETWIAVLKGLERFEARSSIKTWMFSILANRAKTLGQRENRVVSFSELDDVLDSAPTVDPGRFKPSSDMASANHWVAFPSAWESIPEELFLSQELLHIVQEAIAVLPGNQQAVITLHDIDGFSVDEICNILGISETNQRVLLHRSRSKVREVLETYLNTEN